MSFFYVQQMNKCKCETEAFLFFSFLWWPASGHYGQVRLVRELATGTSWAGKFLKLRRSVSSRLGLERKSVEREVEILQALQHSNIMALKDVFESKAEVVLIVEL